MNINKKKISQYPVYTPISIFNRKLYFANELGEIFCFDPNYHSNEKMTAPLGKITTEIRGFESMEGIWFLISKTNGELLIKNEKFELVYQISLGAESWSGLQSWFQVLIF